MSAADRVSGEKTAPLPFGRSHARRAVAAGAGLAATGAAARRHHLELTRDLFLAAQPDTRSGCLAAMLQMDLRVGIAAIGVPTTVMVGDRDLLTPRARAEEFASAIPGARLVTVRGRGHMLRLEAPDEVASQIVAAANG